MQPPVDYPIDDHAHRAHFAMDELFYATLLDRMDAMALAREESLAYAPAFDFDVPAQSPVALKNLPLPILVFAQTIFSGNVGLLLSIDSVFSRCSRVLR